MLTICCGIVTYHDLMICVCMATNEVHDSYMFSYGDVSMCCNLCVLNPFLPVSSQTDYDVYDVLYCVALVCVHSPRIQSLL